MEYHHRYLIDCKWLKQWKICTNFDDWNHTSAGEPGPIDNTNLYKGTCICVFILVLQWKVDLSLKSHVTFVEEVDLFWELMINIRDSLRKSHMLRWSIV